MFSQVTYQPQVVAALSHVSTMINTVRQSTSVVVCPRGNTRAARVSGCADRSKLTEQKQEEDLKLPDLDLDACLSILTQDEHLHRLGALLGLPPGSRCRPSDPWHTSYVSADTFFENKTGFEESTLSESSNSFTMFLCPSIRQQLLQSPKYPVVEQKDGDEQKAEDEQKARVEQTTRPWQEENATADQEEVVEQKAGDEQKTGDEQTTRPWQEENARADQEASETMRGLVGNRKSLAPQSSEKM